MFLSVEEFGYKILLQLVAMIYDLISEVFDVFIRISTFNFFDEQLYEGLVEKIYIVLGIVMLFVLSYNLLTFIIDPEKDKGGKESQNLVKNIVITFIIIVLCPTLFNFAYKIQDVVINGGYIAKIFNSGDSYYSDSSVSNSGRNFTFEIFNMF